MSARLSYLFMILFILLTACGGGGGGNGGNSEQHDTPEPPNYTAEVLDINTNQRKVSASIFRNPFVELNGWTYFPHNDLIHGTELWRTNNSVTERVTDLNARGSSDPESFTIYNGWLYFVAVSDTRGQSLWRSNGIQTEAVDQSGVSVNRVSELVVYNNWLYFTINNDSTTAEIWRTDGSVTEPAGIFSPGPRTYFGDFYVFDGWLYFNHRARLTRTNLTSTESVSETLTGNPIGQAFGYYVQADNMYFMSYEANSQVVLWQTNNSSTVKLKDLANRSYLFEYGGLVHFPDTDTGGNSELWSINGITTSLVFSSAGTDRSGYKNFRVFKDDLYFSAVDITLGNELHVYDGSAISVVSDINLNGSSDPGYLRANADRLYFVAADDGINFKVWSTDGTTAPIVSASNPVDMSRSGSVRLYNVGSKIYIMYNTNGVKELWVEDAGVSLVGDLTTYGTDNANPINFITAGDEVYFLADDGVGGYEIWRASGTVKTRLTDINATSNEYDIVLMSAYNGYIYYSRFSDSLGDNELWRTNGVETEQVLDTSTGNQIVTDLMTEGDLGISFKLGSDLYFIAWSISESRYSIYKTNGVETVVVTPLGSNRSFTDKARFIVFNSYLYFTKSDEQSDVELWRTDGNTVTRVQDINTVASSNPRDFTVSGGWLYFVADDGQNNAALWRTNGTVTTIVLDENGIPFSDMLRLFNAGNKLYFITSANSSDVALWHTNGLTSPQAIDLSVTGIDWRPYVREFYAAGDSLIINSPFDSWLTSGGVPILISNSAINSAPSVYKGWTYYENSNELYRTNGVVVEAIFEESDNVYVRGTGMVLYNDYLFYASERSPDGNGLWFTDGANHYRVSIPNPDGQGSYINNIIKAGSTIYYQASGLKYGDELWVLREQ